MVWRKIFRGLNRSSTKSAKTRKHRRLRVERMERRELLASDLGSIAGVTFVDENNDGSSVGDPPVLVDGGGNLVAPGTAGAQGIQVQLFRDSNSNTIFDSGTDTLVGTDITDLTGNYRFDNLTEDRYFLQQQSVPELNTPASITVDVTAGDADGTQAVLIDDYSLTSQSVTADNATPNNTNFALASEVVGGERDIEVTNTAGLGQITVLVDPIPGTLSIGSLGNGEGTALLQYDGTDGTIALDATGLSSVSLTGDPTGTTPDPAAGLIVLTRSDAAGETLTVTVHTDAANSSDTTIAVPLNLGSTVETFVPFSAFSIVSGTGADFTDVGAIEASVTLAVDSDVIASIVESRRSGVVAASIANMLPVDLGGELFDDNSVGGQNNGIKDPPEGGLLGVTVNLYEMVSAGDVVDPAVDTPLATTTTTTGGEYNFPGLNPGNYAVVIPASQLQGGGVLAGYSNSTGNDPLSDPDDNADQVDDGTTLPSGDVISQTITLESNNEPTDDGDTDPNTNTTVDFGFFPQIDLELTKELNVGLSNVVAGGNVVFDFTIENIGVIDGTSVELVDVFPAGLTYTGFQNPSGAFTVNAAGTNISVDIGTLPAGTTGTIQLLGSFDANQTSDITNVATVTGYEIELDNTNNTDDQLLEFVESDLLIVKQGDLDTVDAGGALTYTLTVTNNGPDAAAGVSVVDTLPEDVTFVSGDVDGNAGQVSFDNVTGILTANVGAMTNGQVASVTVNVTVGANPAATLSNTATVSATPNTDSNLANNSSNITTAVNRFVDLAVQKTVSGTPISGQDITYSLTVTNNGATDAADVLVTDTLDDQLTFVSFDALASGATQSLVGQDLSFDVGTLLAGAAVTFEFDAAIDPAAVGTIPNSATVSTTDTDTVPGNNSDSTSVLVDNRIDLILDKTVDLSTAVPGLDQLVYTFTISHDTDSVSDGNTVVVSDAIPAGLNAVTITDGEIADSKDYDPGTGVVTVQYDLLPNGETRTFTVTATIQEDATGTVVNTASVSSAGNDLDPANNTSSATTTLTPDFDVQVLKSADDPNSIPQDTVVYSVTVLNTGPSTAPGVILTDVLPAGVTLVSATLDGQAGVDNAGTITFPAVDMASNQTANATITVTVDTLTDGLITNIASVQDLSSEGENDTENNSASADVIVIAEADLGVTKTVSPLATQIGGTLTYTIDVTNSGPSTASNVVITDTLPIGVSFVSGTGPAGEVLTESGGVVTANMTTLADNDSGLMTITVLVEPGAASSITNNVAIASDTGDSNATNDVASVVTAVDPKNSTISGKVFVDLNDNGVQDTGEGPIEGAQINLTGSDLLGAISTQVVFTDSNGDYLFTALAQGTYEVVETQPFPYREGQVVVGVNATANVGENSFTDLVLGESTDASGFNFAELNQILSKRLFLATPHVSLI